MTDTLWTPGPWMVAGVRGKLDQQAVHNVFRYDAEKKRDEQIAAVWYDVKTGLGHADARLIAAAPDMAEALAVLDEVATDRAVDAPEWRDSDTVSVILTICGVPMTPEQTLWQNVVLRALLDATYTGDDVLLRVDMRKADAWLRKGGHDFRHVCDLAGMNPAFVREAYLEGRINGDRLRSLAKTDDAA